MFFFLGFDKERFYLFSRVYNRERIWACLSIQSLDQQIKIYEYFSFDNRAQNSLSFLTISSHDT